MLRLKSASHGRWLMPESRMKNRDVDVVVADAAIGKQMTIAAMNVDQIVVPPDGLLRLKARYHLEEQSPDRESYRFRLDAKLADHEATAIANHDDTWGFPDKKFGVCQIVFSDLPPGDHELRFEYRAEYGIGAWDSSNESIETVELERTIKVFVQE